MNLRIIGDDNRNEMSYLRRTTTAPFQVIVRGSIALLLVSSLFGEEFPRGDGAAIDGAPLRAFASEASLVHPGSPQAERSAMREKRDSSEVEALITREGRTAPDWWNSVALEYPPTLDLSWPDNPPGPWNARKNVGQYVWSVINENPRKWKSGIRFLHHLLTVHKEDRGKLRKVMDALATAYGNLLEDRARAAFWWRQAEQRGPLSLNATIRLAECYWMLGSKTMAVRQLAKADRYYSVAAIKLWSDMGEFSKAVSLADEMARAGAPAVAYLVAGDACRLHHRYKRAVAYYEKVLKVPAVGRRKEHIQKTHKRARASIEAVNVFDALNLLRIPNGTYKASSIAYEAPLEVEVVVRKGRIESVRVTKHREKQFYSSITATPRQIVEKQGVKGVDAVTGATITSEAIINATAKALAGAMPRR